MLAAGLLLLPGAHCNVSFRAAMAAALCEIVQWAELHPFCTRHVAEVLEHAAYLGMSAMLVGPLFAPDVRNPQVGRGRRLAHGHSTLHSPALACTCTSAYSLQQLCANPRWELALYNQTLQGRVFAWIDRMLAAQPSAARLADWGPPKGVVARSALTNLLQVRNDSCLDDSGTCCCLQRC